MKKLRTITRTGLIGGAVLLTAYAGLMLTRLTVGSVVDAMGLDVPDAVLATSTAEVIARTIACGVILWKLSSVVADAEDARTAWELVQARSMLFGLAMFATLFMAMDQRIFWWFQYVSGGVQDYSRAGQTLHQSAFTAFAVNCVTLLMLQFRTWRSAALAFAWLSFVTAGGFIAALWYRGVFS